MQELVHSMYIRIEKPELWSLNSYNHVKVKRIKISKAYCNGCIKKIMEVIHHKI